jgi:hypothetical protein
MLSETTASGGIAFERIKQKQMLSQTVVSESISPYSSQQLDKSE